MNKLIADPPPGAPVPPILPPQDGFLFLDKDKFHASFAADVNPDLAAFMADSQVPWGVDALSGEISDPAWRNKPTWYLNATEDLMITPDAQRFLFQTRTSGRLNRDGVQRGQLRPRLPNRCSLLAAAANPSGRSPARAAPARPMSRRGALLGFGERAFCWRLAGWPSRKNLASRANATQVEAAGSHAIYVVPASSRSW